MGLEPPLPLPPTRTHVEERDDGLLVLLVAAGACHLGGGLALLVTKSLVRPKLQKHTDRVDVAVVSRTVEGRPVVLVADVDLQACRQKPGEKSGPVS